MTKNENLKSLSGSALARKLGVSPKTVMHNWVKKGCPRNQDKTFDLDAVQAWRRAQEAESTSSAASRSSISSLQERRLALQCEKLELELQVQRGQLHDKNACAQSLASVVNEALLPLTYVHLRVKEQFPDVSDEIINCIATAINDAFAMIREALLSNRDNPPATSSNTGATVSTFVSTPSAAE